MKLTLIGLSTLLISSIGSCTPKASEGKIEVSNETPTQPEEKVVKTATNN